MTQIKQSIRSMVMDLLKTKFGKLNLWKRIEMTIALMVADLPDPINEKKKELLVEQLSKIKNFLLNNEKVGSEDLIFLDEEVERYSQTKQITLYSEDEDFVEPCVIDKYANLGYGTEGIIGIHPAYNYSQLKSLTRGVFKKTGLIKFYISREMTIYGKIIVEFYEYPQKIPIATLAETKKKIKDTDIPFDRNVFLFGQKINTTTHVKIKEIEAPFYVYQFITEHNQELILLSTNRISIGDYVITGVLTQCDDYKSLTASAKLPTKLPFFFVQSFKNKIIKFDNHDEFRDRLKFLDVSKSNIFDYPFSVEKDKKKYVLKHPVWFKWLLWSWLVHADIGMFNKYPLHLFWIGPMHSGKSLQLNCLHALSKEAKSVFSGSSSTFLYLVPSFKFNQVKLGYLAESNRFSFCDEFLRCILLHRGNNNNNTGKEEGMAIMNDLLEHQKREVGSGVSRGNVNMTSRVIATTNPVREIHNMEDALKMIESSFASRWLFYYQTEDHLEMIRHSSDSNLKPYTYDLNVDDWISIVDYLHTFKANYDMNRVKEIYKSVIPVLSDNLAKHYDARHMHHIECLIDGIVKTRCLFEHEIGFNAKKEDYEMLEEVWKKVIRSWITPEMINRIPIDQRIFYLPERVQFLYWRIENFKRAVTRIETEECIKDDMDKKEYLESMMILLHNGVLIEKDGMFFTHNLVKI